MHLRNNNMYYSIKKSFSLSQKSNMQYTKVIRAHLTCHSETRFSFSSTSQENVHFRALLTFAIQDIHVYITNVYDLLYSDISILFNPSVGYFIRFFFHLYFSCTFERKLF